MIPHLVDSLNYLSIATRALISFVDLLSASILLRG